MNAFVRKSLWELFKGLVSGIVTLIIFLTLLKQTQKVSANTSEVTDPKGQRVRFGERLERHLAEKSPEEQARRLVKLDYAMDAVRTTEPILNPRGLADRNVYVKPTSERTSVMVFVNNKGEVQEVFDVFSKNTKDVRRSIGK